MTLQVRRRQRVRTHLEEESIFCRFTIPSFPTRTSGRRVSARNAIEIDTANAFRELAKEGELA
jgi:hypothetical protein